MMLVKCPRCGFSQPQDKYCAQCGVDTETFIPPRKSAFVRYTTNPLLYLTMALIAISISIATLYKRDHSDLAQRVKFLKGSLQIANTYKQERRQASKKEEESPDSSADSSEEIAAPSQMVPAATAAAASPSPAATTSAMKKNSPSSAEPMAYVYYAEVPRQSLEKIFEESLATGQFNSFGDYTAGILPDMQKRITAAGLKIHILEKSEKAISKNQQWFIGIHDPESDEDLGLSTFIELNEVENNTFRGNLEIVRSLREVDLDRTRNIASVDPAATGGVQKNSYPAIFELGPGNGFFISGILPRKTHIAHEEELMAKAPFEILKSTNFQNKESEFVIFIEFEKKP
ncbi:MAG: hypothetical protein ACXWRE_01745 [Pseudobdellovibrionaceae bacterium]